LYREKKNPNCDLQILVSIDIEKKAYKTLGYAWEEADP
jgi:hypothetical protein